MFCKRTQPSTWQCFWRCGVAAFAVIGFFGTLAFLKKRGKKMKKAVARIGGECIDACESLCDEMCDCMSEGQAPSSKSGKPGRQGE